MSFRILFGIFMIAGNALFVKAQKVIGSVYDSHDEPLVGATVLEMNTNNGTITDIHGAFDLDVKSSQPKLVVSFAGFEPDTVEVAPGVQVSINLKEKSEELGEVVVRARSTFVDELEAKHVEVITTSELTKAACCNLSESFETNASVDVSYTDGVSGTKTIRMLGLDGRYVQINRENVPHVRGLTGRNGLLYVPGTWIQSVDVGKGAGTVVNGYESMTGQINVELKKPETADKLYLNAYANSFGRVELNADHSVQLSDRIGTTFLLHSDYFGNELDQNEDGFMDLPKSRQINFMNRYKYSGDRVQSQWGIQLTRDEKAGGQLGYGFEDDFLTSNEYGFQNQTTRVELFGKTGILFPEKPYQGVGFIYSGSIANIQAGYGRNAYSGTERAFYGNTIYQNIIGSTFHQYKAGASLLLDDFDEEYMDSTFTRSEVVPGVYYEYSYLPGEKFTLVAGLRSDFHNLYGTFFTPRLHLRYQLTEKSALRMAAGRGFRTANAFVEGSNYLVSNRQVKVLEEPEPEVSWNLGTSLVTQAKLANVPIDLTIDYFYTFFENQLILDADMDVNELNIYNLAGDSRAHSFQIEASIPLTDYFGLKGAYKRYDVQSTMNGRLQEVPLISSDRIFLNAAYATKYEKWKADLTVHWYGRQRLPDTNGQPEAFRRPGFTPDYWHLNAQISRGFRWGHIYLGSENLLNFTQGNPMVDPENPFGNNFDASFVWAPIAGRMIYAGFRYQLKK